METTPHLTPEQRGLLQDLARQSGKDPQDVLEEVFEQVRARMRSRSTDKDTERDAETPQSVKPSRKPIWEDFIEASLEIPDEELERLPADGASQHDHYIYGTPKRPL